MPSPTMTFSGATPRCFASARLMSWFSGSQYCQLSAAAACMAATTAGDGPNTLSLAPMRARNLVPERRSSASGPTKGTEEGSVSTRGVNGNGIRRTSASRALP